MLHDSDAFRKGVVQRLTQRKPLHHVLLTFSSSTIEIYDQIRAEDTFKLPSLYHRSGPGLSALETIL